MVTLAIGVRIWFTFLSLKPQPELVLIVVEDPDCFSKANAGLAREINFIFPSIHVLCCIEILLFIG